ncbi:response regulator [Devosia beringensis]|uniref:response regulator n=1 Tax=Devosia beringensis TaxID=2657486 RepID=UPI00186B8CB6|nr:response regulator [Devosia beringensis]
MTSVSGGVVLVVEDEALLLFSIADDLRELGFSVLEARNADEAVARLEAHAEIAVVFTDIDMPGSMDGLGLTALVDQRWPALKVVVTSGKKLPDRAAMPEGVQFLSKPYAIEQVVRAIG